MKATLARSIKFGSHKNSNELMVHEIAKELLGLAKESDPVIKKNAFEGLTTLVHNNWTFVRDLIKDMENFAYQETKIRKEIIEEVDLGPFKHKVDKGLPMRKQAFQLLETLVDRCVDQIDPLRLVEEVVITGLRDTEEEVIALNLLILGKLCGKANAVVISRID